MTRAIIHLDLDAFYASVEQLRRPALRGRPVIVAGGGDRNARRSVVSAASYEARPFGVRSAMPLMTALKLCPQAEVVAVDFPAYREASAAVFAIARRFTPVIEPLSLDEAFLDVTHSQLRFGPATQIAASIRDLIQGECGLHASFGLAGCKTVAKIASELEKPRGFVVVEPGREAEFLAPLPLRALPGLGPAAERALAGTGATTLGALARLGEAALVQRLGEAAGRSLWRRAQGIDEAAVALPGPPKSISREQTFAVDVRERGEIERRLRHLAVDVAFRLRSGSWRARTVAVRMRYPNFHTVTRQRTLPAATDGERALVTASRELFGAAWSGVPVRLVGVSASGLEPGSQLDLPTGAAERDGKLDRTLDDLQRRFGATAVRRGSDRSELDDLDFRGEDLRQPSSST